MPAGMQVFDGSGTLRLEISDRVYRLLTIMQVPTSDSGSQAVTGLDGGVPIISAVQITTTRRGPTIGVSGGNVTWDYTGVPSGERDTNLHISVAVF